MAKAKKKLSILPASLALILLGLLLFTYQAILSDKYYPLTWVGDTNISFLTKPQAYRLIQSRFENRASQKLQFSYPQGSFTVDLATSSANLDYAALDEEFSNTHHLFPMLLVRKIAPQIKFNVDKQLDIIASAVDQKAQNAQLIFKEVASPEGTPSAQIQIKDGQNGLALDKEAITKNVLDFLLSGKYNSQLPFKVVPPKVTTDHLSKAKQALEESENQPIQLTFAQQKWTIDTKQLLTLLDLTHGEGSLLDKEQTKQYLTTLSSEIDQPVQEGLFEFNPQTRRVNAFQPSQEGRKLDQDKTFQLMEDALTPSAEKTISLPVDVVKPKIQTSDVNSLGIKELLGRGISSFAGSIPNRIYNIGLTASRINGVLIPPGETFSFNQTVGDISAATGFKQAYVIKEGRTVLDDGGGVCQDSTTLFRAVLNAGLPVVARTAHAYRVGYYEQGFPPGLDATVFYPSVDFQFKNDTANHILVQAYTAGTTLYVDLYGTDDGRVASLTRPIITNQTPPPPDLRQDDPTLPKGTIKQVDWSAWGAQVSFKRTVVRNGETLLNETWRSNYKPWQAVYLVGTQ